MTASATLKARHSDYLLLGLLTAVLIHAVAFAFWPEYVPGVYRAPEAFVPQLIPPPDIFEIPLPPREVEPPARPEVVLPSDDADLDETIAPTLFNSVDDMPVIPPPPPSMDEDFIAFDDPPELLEAASPVYPDIARSAGVEGLVVVIVLLDEAGNVISAEIAPFGSLRTETTTSVSSITTPVRRSSGCVTTSTEAPSRPWPANLTAGGRFRLGPSPSRRLPSAAYACRIRGRCTGTISHSVRRIFPCCARKCRCSVASISLLAR